MPAKPQRIACKGSGVAAPLIGKADRNLPDVSTRHVASIVYQYQPKVLAKERDRLEKPFGFVVKAYRSDPEINTPALGAKP